MKRHKYIFVVGGVMSGVGKGITTSSIGTIFQAKGYSVNIIKADPYLNVDAGTMNPTEHGEVFVLNCGLETDQDMGNYERFLNRDASELDYMTSGMVYSSVIKRERELGYKGKCVEAVPHIREEITSRIIASAKKSKSDISIIEIGGTIGDYQNIMFIEAARVLKLENPEDVAVIMVSFLPIPGTLGEMKSKPTQNAVRQLNSYGLNADFIIARSEFPLDDRRKEKIAISCNVPAMRIISAPDIESIYDVPENFEKDKLSEMLEKMMHMKSRKMDLSAWSSFVKKVKNTKKEVTIAIVGKYFDTGDFVLSDAYVSVIEAIKFSAFTQGAKPKIIWMNSKHFEGDIKKAESLCKEQFANVDGIIVPGGFGETGVEGKMRVIKYARENKIPYFGLCYGMQLMVVEYARNMAGLTDAHTTEINKDTKYPVIDIMESQKKHMKDGNYGGSMRLGAYPCELKSGSIARKAYENAGKGKISGDKYTISERHRHRFEVNNQYIEDLKKAGLIFSGTSPDGSLMEIAELPKSVHPFFLGTQFHPELLARPLDPHPLFTDFIKAALSVKK
ncbi:TPA: CTP synthase [Candidatus Nomurabacteria bacterium]|nr:CTP synthase [Candidatus Nomurabacteria bacterium]